MQIPLVTPVTAVAPAAPTPAPADASTDAGGGSFSQWLSRATPPPQDAALASAGGANPRPATAKSTPAAAASRGAGLRGIEARLVRPDGQRERLMGGAWRLAQHRRVAHGRANELHRRLAGPLHVADDLAQQRCVAHPSGSGRQQS